MALWDDRRTFHCFEGHGKRYVSAHQPWGLWDPDPCQRLIAFVATVRHALAFLRTGRAERPGQGEGSSVLHHSNPEPEAQVRVAGF